jgi:hypothetical protein
LDDEDYHGILSGQTPLVGVAPNKGMPMIKRRTLLAVGLLAGLSLGSVAAPPPRLSPQAALFNVGDASEAELRVIAQADLARRIAVLAKEDPASLPVGFPFNVQAISELRLASIGYGFQMYSPDASAAKRGPLDQTLVPTGLWRFAVMVGGRSVGLLTLARMSGQTRVVEVGAAKLAASLDALASSHAAKGALRLRFVRIPAARLDLLEVSYPGMPLQYERLAEPGMLLRSDQVADLLR